MNITVKLSQETPSNCCAAIKRALFHRECCR